jgi:hypothetical protein
MKLLAILSMMVQSMVTIFQSTAMNADNTKLLFTIAEGNIMVKLSKTSKLDGILSWSLQAIETCPASIKEIVDGVPVLVDACKGCYATTGFYQFGPAKDVRAYNKEDWKRAEWVDEMVSALDSSRYFRFFDSGDMYDIRLAEKIYQVMLRASFCTFWLPTRMYKFEKFKAVIDKMNALPNVVVRFSSDSINGGLVAGQYTSTIVETVDNAGTAVACRAYEHEGKCNGCRACWNKAVDTIAYVAHGKKMQKVIRINKAA